MWRVHISRRLNGALGGCPHTMFSARVYREDRQFCVLVIDLLFFIIRREVRHCEKMSRYEAQAKASQSQAREAEANAHGVAHLSQKGGELWTLKQ